MKTITMCDPPEGWMYGFPKSLPKDFDSQQELNDWLISEGYPRNKITFLGENFYCRYWKQEIEE